MGPRVFFLWNLILRSSSQLVPSQTVGAQGTTGVRTGLPLAGVLVLVGTLLIAGAMLTAPGVRRSVASLPTTELKPVGPGSTPFLATTFDLAADNYVEDEYFVTGTANIYEYDINKDVQVVTPNVPYKSRMLIRRPANPNKFKGTVVIEWLNPTAGFDGDTIWLTTYKHLIKEGAIWVGVTIKPVSVNFLPGWNPVRYAGLQMTDVAQTWDLMSQVGALLKDRTSPENPLAAYDVQRNLGVGYSQSATYLITYSNEFHDGATLPDGRHAFDGYFIAAAGGSAQQINSASSNVSDERRFIAVNAPVIRFQTETEVIGFGAFTSRQPDSPTFRMYEMAGGSHVDVQSNELLFGTAWARDLGFSPVTCANLINPIRIGHLETSSVHLLDRWVRDGTPPPPSQLITLVSSGGVTSIARDADGNAIGGVRLPTINVPLGTYRENNTGSGFCFLFGSFLPFDEAKLAELYPTHGNYISQITQTAKESVKAGFLLEEDAEQLRTEAAQSDIGR